MVKMKQKVENIVTSNDILIYNALNLLICITIYCIVYTYTIFSEGLSLHYNLIVNVETVLTMSMVLFNY